ncbi:MAG: alpha/beta hydrolase [Candidatus Competibacteraceae bacterium]
MWSPPPTLGWDRFALLGHSLGGGIASFVAATLPERIDRVAMIEGLGPPTSNPADGPANLRKTIQQMDALPHHKRPRSMRIWKPRFRRAARLVLSWVAATILVERSVRPVDGGWLAHRSSAAFRLAMYPERAANLGLWNCIVAPALLICGADGYLVKRAYMQERYARIADLTVKILPGGHHPHLEDPEPCAHLLAPFLTAV